MYISFLQRFGGRFLSFEGGHLGKGGILYAWDTTGNIRMDREGFRGVKMGSTYTPYLGQVHKDIISCSNYYLNRMSQPTTHLFKIISM